MIKQGQLHNFPWNVYVDGCGTLTGWNGKNSLTAGRDGVLVMQLPQQGLAGDGLSFCSRRLFPLLACQPQAPGIWGTGLVVTSPSRLWESYHHREQENTALLSVLYSWFICRHGSVQSKCKPHASTSLYM